MKQVFTVLTLSLVSFQAYSFHEVTEIFPSGKILVCKDFGQVRKGNIVEKYSNKSPSSRIDKTLIKTGEILLPAVGQKITLTNRDFRREGKLLKISESKEIGTAIVSSDSLEGEDRIIHSKPNTRFGQQTEQVVKISKEDAIKLQKDCFVAVLENGLKLKERASVSW